MTSKLLAFCVVAAASVHLLHAGAIPPFTLDLSTLGSSSAVSGSTIAGGLDFPYGLAAMNDGSILFGESNPTTQYGIEGAPSTGSVWILPKHADGSFGAAQQVIGSLKGPVTSVQAGPDGMVVVESGALSDRTMSFYNQNFQSLGNVQFSYPTYAWWHPTGVSLVAPQPDGSDRVYFIVGSEADGAKTTAQVSTTGLFNATLNADSVYMVTVKNSGGSLQTIGAPTQVASGLRNPYGLSLDVSGNLIIGDNGQDGPYIGHELGADTLHLIPAAQIGLSVPDFGFPASYVDFGTGVYVNGDPGATPPLAAFIPVVDSNGDWQYSEGVSAIGYVAPLAMSFVGAQGGEFLGFHGAKNGTGAANDDNAFLYYDFASGKYYPLVDAGTAGVGHLDSILVSGNTLFIADMATAGVVDGVGGGQSGAIYEFTLMTPEPGTAVLGILGIVALILRRKRTTAL
jgi:glucose/arabinose dehydrogenase